MHQKIKSIALFLFFISFVISCKKDTAEEKKTDTTTSLKQTFLNDFYMGAALNANHINGTDTLALKVLQKEFNTITPENVMKWMYIHPERDSFYFDMVDKYVALGEKNDMHIVGHTLVWHSQIASWMNEITDSTEMANYMKAHINTIVNRYKNRINSWDVVNEALNDDGTLRESLFLKVMGEGYIEQAFKLAATADPEAELVYNDYNLSNSEKRAGLVRLVKQLKANGAKIDAIGMQGHYGLTSPSIEDIEKSILTYADLDVKVLITELDISILPNPWDLEGAAVEQNYDQLKGDSLMNPYPNPDNLPDSVKMKIAKRYEDIFSLFLKHKDKISRVTFWGVNDGQSWLNNWPIKGRTNYPLLFDRKFKPKKAYKSVMNLKKQNE